MGLINLVDLKGKRFAHVESSVLSTCNNHGVESVTGQAGDRPPISFLGATGCRRSWQRIRSNNKRLAANTRLHIVHVDRSST